VLVAFEGIDGSGKSTVIQAVAAALRKDGLRVHVTQEPTSTWLGRAVRKAISSKLDPLSLAFLFLADRAQHVRAIADRREDVVLTDRYCDSTTAYQAAALADRLPSALDYFQRLQGGLFPAPDLGILLDVPSEVGVARIASRSKKEPFEKIQFLRRVRSNYLKLAAGNRLIVVDATTDPAIVADKATALVRRIVAAHRQPA
jgi:dTMP kinase